MTNFLSLSRLKSIDKEPMGNNPNNRDWKGYATPGMLLAAIITAFPTMVQVRDTQIRQEVQIEVIRKQHEELLKEQQMIKQRMDELLQQLQARKVVLQMADTPGALSGERNKTK